jgi:RHS repeat-associated protein
MTQTPAAMTRSVACSFSVASRNGYKFTGKERDSESGLDYFGARHHASALGRFMSADPKLMTARHLGSPQKWNKYAYVQNNPLMRVDPDGQDDWVVFRTALDPKTKNETLAGTHTKEWKAAEKAITGQRDSKGRLNTFTMYEGPGATVERLKTAQSTPDTHVVFVGHSQENPDSGRANAIVMSNGISSGKDGSQSVTPGPNEDAPMGFPTTTYGFGDPISASSVALFGCNTYDLASEYPGADFTGVQSGPSGTMTGTLDLAAAAFVTAGGGQAGANAGNATIENSVDKRDTGSNVATDAASQ